MSTQSTTRHAELVSASIVPQVPSLMASWALKHFPIDDRPRGER
jgi:hypothetical protein